MKPATSSNARRPGLRTVAQPVQPVLDEDAVFPGERNHVGHGSQGDNLQERFGDAALLARAAQPMRANSAWASLNATPAPHRFFSG